MTDTLPPLLSEQQIICELEKAGVGFQRFTGAAGQDIYSTSGSQSVASLVTGIQAIESATRTPLLARIAELEADLAKAVLDAAEIGADYLNADIERNQLRAQVAATTQPAPADTIFGMKTVIDKSMGPDEIKIVQPTPTDQPSKAGAQVVSERVDFVVSAVVIKDTATGFNTQNKLYAVCAAGLDEANGKVLPLLAVDFPQHRLHTMCSYPIAQPAPPKPVPMTPEDERMGKLFAQAYSTLAEMEAITAKAKHHHHITSKGE